MYLKCHYDDCRKVTSVKEWNEITKQKNKDQFKALDKCIEVCDSTMELEGMHFYCPICERCNDGSRVEEIQ